MKKKICPWCEEELPKDGVCNCSVNSQYMLFANGEHFIRFWYDEVDKLISMKAEHAQLKAEAERTRWHSVAEEGLPTELRKQYLIKPKIGKTIVDILWEYIDEETGEQCIALGDYGEDEVVAWAELLEPYKNN